MPVWLLTGADHLDALEHGRDRGRSYPVIAEAAAASDCQELRGDQLAQVVARGRRRDLGPVSELFGRERLSAHKSMKHRCSRSVTHESGHFYEIFRLNHSSPYRRYQKDINRKQFGVDRTVRPRHI